MFSWDIKREALLDLACSGRSVAARFDTMIMSKKLFFVLGACVAEGLRGL